MIEPVPTRDETVADSDSPLHRLPDSLVPESSLPIISDSSNTEAATIKSHYLPPPVKPFDETSSSIYSDDTASRNIQLSPLMNSNTEPKKSLPQQQYTSLLSGELIDPESSQPQIGSTESLKDIDGKGDFFIAVKKKLPGLI